MRRKQSVEASLDEALPELGPFEDSAWVIPGGPTVRYGRGATAVVYTQGAYPHAAAAIDGGNHPLTPTILHRMAPALIISGDVKPSLDAAEVLPTDGALIAETETRGALLTKWMPGHRWTRVLGRLGVPRRKIDRWLGASVRTLTRTGPSLGGAHPMSVGSSAGRPVALDWQYARPDGRLAVDAAGLALGGDIEAARRWHRESVGEQIADEAFEIALVGVFARAGAGGAATLEALFDTEPVPATVNVWIQGPAFIDVTQWEVPGASVSPSRARWLLQQLDGLSVGGAKIRVRTEPPIRRGRRPPRREPTAERNRRLFERWAEGIETDDEGRVGLTPEALAMRIASGARGVVLDGNCGVGGLTIAYARQPGVHHVIAVERDAERLAMARRNAALYGVADRVRWVVGDSLAVLERERPDVLVLDPPWGGRSYDRDHLGLHDLEMDVGAACDAFDGEIVLKLPRSFDVDELPEGRWELEAMVDERGILKMLVARRPPIS